MTKNTKVKDNVEVDLSKLTKTQLIAYAIEQKEKAEQAKLANTRNVDNRKADSFAKLANLESTDSQFYTDIIKHIQDKNDSEYNLIYKSKKKNNLNNDVKKSDTHIRKVLSCIRYNTEKVFTADFIKALDTYFNH